MSEPLRALTVRQPWAQLIAEGVKTIETRSWTTNYRGPLAVHAGKADETLMPLGARSTLSALGYDELPRGSFVCIVDLVDVVPITKLRIDSELHGWEQHEGVSGYAVGADETLWGLWDVRKYGWLFGNVRKLDTFVRSTGRMGLWHVDPRTAVQLYDLTMIKGNA